MPRSCSNNLRFACVALALALTGCGGVTAAVDAPEAPAPVATFDRMPAGVAVWGDDVFVSFPRWVEPGEATVYRGRDGAWHPFPDEALQRVEDGPASLHSVNGLTVDAHGRLWMLDNGRIDLGPAAEGVPKLVVWDLEAEREAFRVLLPEAVAPARTSFVNDLAVDVERGIVYITETGLGGVPALLVVDLLRDRVARVLEGHPSVAADPTESMIIDGEVILAPSGAAPWRVAANAIALSDDGETLYFGAMTSRTLYRVPTAALRQAAFEEGAPDASAEIRAARAKPITDGIARCADDTLVMTDIEASRLAVGPLDADRSVPLGDGLAFPVAVVCTDDAVWATSNELHGLPLLHNGEDRRNGAFHLWRFPRD